MKMRYNLPSEDAKATEVKTFKDSKYSQSYIEIDYLILKWFNYPYQ